MKSFRFVLIIAILNVAAAHAAHVDMNDPRRALGREDDIRVDAQLLEYTVSSGSPVSVMYQIENLSHGPVAVADKVCDISYDKDSRTIMISVGAEVPTAGTMPHLVTIAPGAKKTFTIGAILHVVSPTVRSPLTAVPRFVQIAVNFLRDLAPFRTLIERQSHRPAQIDLTDAQFDQWLESNDTIFLNTIPVHYNSSAKNGTVDASQAHNISGSRF